MKNNAILVYGLMLVVSDFVALLGSFVLAYLIRVRLDPRPLADQVAGITYLKIFALLIPFYILIFALLGLYNRDIYERRFRELGRLIMGTIIGMLGILAFDYASDQPIFPARLVPVYALGISLALVVFGRSILRWIRHTLFAYEIGINKVLLIGSTPVTAELANIIGNTNKSGYKIVGYFGGTEEVPEHYGALQHASLSEALDSLVDVDTIIQTELYIDDTNQRIIDAAQQHHVAYKFMPSNVSLYAGNNEIELFHNFPIVSVHPTALTGWGRIVKRLFDIFGALIGLLISLPIFIVIGIFIKLTDRKGPIFYKHGRVSRYGKMFGAHKLRSMYWRYSPGGGSKKTEEQIFSEMGRDDLIDEWRERHKVKDDPRIMPIGKFIRKTSIDELPQLLNVLKGELSLIGPRPITKKELEKYEDASSIFLSIRPGITGLWQVSGRNETTFEERIALDLYYVQHWSFWLDLKILYRTLIVMLTAKGE